MRLAGLLGPRSRRAPRLSLGLRSPGAPRLRLGLRSGGGPGLRQFAPRATLAGMLAAAAAGAAVGLAVLSGGLLAGVEQSTLAARFTLRAAHRPSDVAVVGIDDRSFAVLRHRWPFPRSWDGEVLRRLQRAGARAVLFDVQVTEPTTPRQDMALFDALGQTGGAVLATTETDGHGHTNVLGGDANLARVHSRAGSGVLPLAPGGAIDRFPYESGGLESAAVAVAARAAGHPVPRDRFGVGGAYIDYQGPPGTIPTLSFADVLDGRFSPAGVRGRVIVIGATSLSLEDMHLTPTSATTLMSGPEIQANAVWTVLHGIPLRPLPLPAAIALVLLAALLAPAVRLRRSAGAAAAAAPLAGLAYLPAAQLAFDTGTVVPVVAPVAALLASAVATLIASHLLVSGELRATQLEIVQRLGRAAESRDGDTGRHLERIGFLAERLARAAGLPRREARLLRQASALHDVGKIAIPDEVLLKPGYFEAADREVMARHTTAGARMLAGSRTSLVQMAEIIALTHHEHWDGSGYPNGLQGEEIPLAGRICAICDVFDALLSRRRYKDSWTLGATLTQIERGAGSHFDPELTRVFLRIAPRLYVELARRVDPDLAAHHVPPAPALSEGWLRRLARAGRQAT